MGGAHLYCAALSCTAHRRPPMDQRGPARAGCQRGVREEAKTPAGLSRGTLGGNIGGRSSHVKASSETSVRVERATFEAILAGAIEVDSLQRLCPHTRSEVIFPIDGMRGSVVEWKGAMQCQTRACSFGRRACGQRPCRVFGVFGWAPAKYTKYTHRAGGAKFAALRELQSEL